MRTITTLLTASLLVLAPLASAADAGKSAGTFAPGERWSAPEPHAPANVSRALVTNVTPLGGKAHVEIPATGGSSLLIWLVPVSEAPASQRALPSTLKSPSGKNVDGDKAKGLTRFALGSEDTGLGLAEGQEVLHVASPEAGSYALDVDASGAAAVTVVSAEPESALVLETWAGPLSRQPGEAVTLHAELRDGNRAPFSAHVSARFSAPDGSAGARVELHDDGKHGDGAAGDGVFAATARLPKEAAGFWSVLFEADGRDSRGTFFGRTGSAGFVSEPGHARILPGGAATAQTAGDGTRSVRVTTGAHIDVPGTYRFEVVVAGALAADGTRPAHAWAESTQTLARGRANLSLDVPIEVAADGPLHVELRLLGLDPMGVAGRQELEVTR